MDILNFQKNITFVFTISNHKCNIRPSKRNTKETEMKHLANIMRFNDWDTKQESTVGRIMEEGRGKKKRAWIEWVGSPMLEEVEGNYQDACRIALNADTWHFISPI